MSTVTLSLMSSDEAKTTRTHKDGIAGKYRAAREKAVKHMRFVPLLHGGAYSVTSKSHAENPVLSPYIVTIYSCSCSYEGLCSHIIAVRDLEIPGHADRFPDTAKTEKAEPRRVCRGVQPTSKPSAFAVGQYPQGEAVPVRNVCRTDAAAKAADFD